MSFFHDALDGLLTTTLPYPQTVSIEPINVCQLQCPLCPTGTGKLNYQRMAMSIETFKYVLDSMPFVRTVDLYKSGEPFLNPDLFAMIRHAADREIDVVVSTHLSFTKPEEFFEDIVLSGLGTLVVSLDGTSQGSYSQYRRGGSYELVLSNLKRVLAAKARLQSQKPTIVWQFLVNRFNEDEIPTARKLAQEMNVVLDIRPIGLADDVPDVELPGEIQERMEQWLPSNQKYVSECYKGEYRLPLFAGICKQLFTRAVIGVDGKVLPCCEVWDRESVFGDLMTKSFEEIWHGPEYRDARLKFLKLGHSSKTSTVCYRCQNYGVTGSLKDKLLLLLAICRKKAWMKKPYRATGSKQNAFQTGKPHA